MSAVTAQVSARAALGRRFRAFRAVWGPLEGKLGIAILLLFAFVIAFGPLLAPYGENEIAVGLPDSGPSAQFWLGTDTLGRDVLSRMLYGGRSVVVIPLLATLLAFLIGGTAGMISGYRGGKLGSVIDRTIDVLISLPYLLVILVVVTVLSTSAVVVIIAVALVFAPRIARVLRGATRQLAVREYVQAAQARGERSLVILWREIAPNMLPTVMVEFATRLTFAIIFVATLNFLGLGLQPPSANWAVMVAENKSAITVNPIEVIAPALAIGAVSLGVSLVADAITQSIGRTGRTDLSR